MKKLFILIAFSFITLAFSQIAAAEVYKWTDANGKVHYSDQKPEKQPKAKDVTQDIKKVNTDSSQKEQQKLEGIFRKENDADRNYQQQQQQQSQPDEEHSNRCEQAKQLLSKMERPIQFIDQDGKAVRMTEAERKTQVQELRDQIKENCSD